MKDAYLLYFVVVVVAAYVVSKDSLVKKNKWHKFVDAGPPHG